MQTTLWISGAVAASIAMQVPLHLRQNRSEITIGPEPRCTRCTIVASSPIRLLPRAPGDQAALARSIDMTPSGHFVVTSIDLQPLPAVYDPTGKFVRLLGRRGEEPGTFSDSAALRVRVGPGDTTFVLDNRSMRLTLLSPSLEFLRSRALILGGANDFLPLSDGSVVVAYHFPTRDLIGLPLHLFSRAGGLRRSFGDTLPRYDTEHELLPARFLSPSQLGGFWSVHAGSYVVEKWDADGSLEHRFVRQNSWLNESGVLRRPTQSQPPSPQITAVREDEKGRVWVATLVPAIEWRRGVGPKKVRGMDVIGTLDFDALFDTILDVVDPATKSLIATARLDKPIHFLLPNGYAATDYLPDRRHKKAELHIVRLTLQGEER